MNKKIKRALSICIILLLIFSGFAMTIILFDKGETYCDLSVYFNQNYANGSFLQGKADEAGKRALGFLPDSDDYRYREEISDFYIFDGSKTLTTTGVTFVLDVSFADRETYSACKQEESLRNYVDEAQSYEKKESFECRIVDDDNIQYAKGESVPWCCGMICTNDDEMIVRYLYFSETDGYHTNLAYMLNCTSCPWT